MLRNIYMLISLVLTTSSCRYINKLVEDLSPMPSGQQGVWNDFSYRDANEKKVIVRMSVEASFFAPVDPKSGLRHVGVLWGGLKYRQRARRVCLGEQVSNGSERSSILPHSRECFWTASARGTKSRVRTDFVRDSIKRGSPEIVLGAPLRRV